MRNNVCKKRDLNFEDRNFFEGQRVGAENGEDFSTSHCPKVVFTSSTGRADATVPINSKDSLPATQLQFYLRGGPVLGGEKASEHRERNK